jgi:hypothetical protein
VLVTMFKAVGLRCYVDWKPTFETSKVGFSGLGNLYLNKRCLSPRIFWLPVISRRVRAASVPFAASLASPARSARSVLHRVAVASAAAVTPTSCTRRRR